VSARIEIPIALETTGIARGAKDGEKALKDLEKAVDKTGKGSKDIDKVEKSLDKIEKSARDGKREVDQLGDTTKDTGRDGSRSIDKIEEELRQTQTAAGGAEDAIGGVGDAGEKAGLKVTRAMGTDIRQGINSVGDLMEGRVAGAMSNLMNATTSIGQSLPLVGIGIAAAAGIAAPILSNWQAEQDEMNARVQRMKEYYADAWQSAAEAGRDYLDTATVVGEMNDLIFNPDREKERNQIYEDGTKLGIDRATMLRAAAGDQEALNVVIGQSAELYGDAAREAGKATEGIGDSLSAQEIEAENLMYTLQQVNDRWKDYGAINDENKQKAADAADMTSKYWLDQVAAADSATRAVDDFGNVLITLPDGVEVLIDAETGKASSDVSKFKTDTDGVIEDLNAKDITLAVKAAVQQAQNTVNNFIASNDGKSFKLNGRVVVDSGWDG
jgi:hypothetical protein